MDDHRKSGLITLAAACITLKGMDIKASPKLTATAADSVRLARLIVETRPQSRLLKMHVWFLNRFAMKAHSRGRLREQNPFWLRFVSQHGR